MTPNKSPANSTTLTSQKLHSRPAPPAPLVIGPMMENLYLQAPIYPKTPCLK